MITYLFHTTLLLSGFTLFYWFVLRHETYFKLNRWTIMMSVFLCLALPLIHIPSSLSLWTNNDAPTETIINTITQTPAVFDQVSADQSIDNSSGNYADLSNDATTTAAYSFSFLSILAILYIIGIVIFSLVFLLQIVVLLTQRYNLNSFQTGKYTIVEMVKDSEPCSFLNYIFINPNKYDEDTYNHIIEHEKAHIDQSHHFDKIIAELLVVLFWFNPLTWLLRKSISQNLEFLTDQSLLDNGVERESYQMSLLKVSVSNKPLNLTASYNSSFLKNRISMMNSQNSSIVSSWKYLFVLPLFLLSIASLNAIQKNDTTTSAITSQVETKQSITKQPELNLPTYKANPKIKTHTSSRNLILPEIEKVGITIQANIYLKQGSKQKVRIEGPEELVQNLNTEVDGTNWNLQWNEGFRNNTGQNIDVHITIEHLTHLAISGMGNITMMNRFKNLDGLNVAISGTGNIKLMADARFVNSALSGSGNIDADIKADICKTVVSGSGNVMLRGSARKSEFISSGSGKLGGLNFKTKECKILVNGSSVVSADIADYLDVNAEGGSLVRYKGEPNIKMKVSKSSQLQHIE